MYFIYCLARSNAQRTVRDILYNRLILSSRYIPWNSKGYIFFKFRTHPEVPDRIQRPYDKHKEYGLLKRCQELPVSQVQLMLYEHLLYTYKIKLYPWELPNSEIKGTVFTVVKKMTNIFKLEETNCNYLKVILKLL